MHSECSRNANLFSFNSKLAYVYVCIHLVGLSLRRQRESYEGITPTKCYPKDYRREGGKKLSPILAVCAICRLTHAKIIKRCRLPNTYGSLRKAQGTIK